MSGRSLTVADRAKNDHRRTPHDYAVDLFTESFLEKYEDSHFDDAILLAEKDYFFTPTNTSLDRIRELGRPRNIYGKSKGDLDFAVIFLDQQAVEHFEFKETEDREDFEPTNSLEEQGERMRETFEYLENMGSEWSYEREVVFLDERPINTGMIEAAHPSEYTEGYHMDEAVEEMARNSEGFEALNKHMFDGRFFHSTKIREK
ncbi:hypothetical protein [Candidatus Nanohalococcus occultus]|uniref:Uncharacterized protein n=1 Tax=Candidatus Nanohalococcus occultus TaxID=2978047 RepID=A0ABY8CD63_9ARCH|nr:hypothetical protein SVXNc_0090 [Candidatus Nanohaloarchaeota archaeon SVXNc]